MDPSQRDFTMDGASGGTLPPGLSEEEALEMQIELTKVEDEIQTLRQVLTAKERHAGELRRRLGISPLAEFKNNISKGWQEVQSSNAYKKTQETLSQAGQMTSSALSTMGSAIRNRFGEMSNNYSMRHSLSMPAMRNSNTFKSFEDKMSKVVGGGSNGEGPQGPPGSNSNF
ncbi:tpd52 like 2a isoform X8 [Astyanax mexicanus]|uniref:tpd52 like 2a isoform X8 n=2 Tax=Astyanax mexicanus TaxID=7994 RepID=UPI000BBDA04D|nr:tpd52 like 2a isoform X8 [Astyanax mexicanus]